MATFRRNDISEGKRSEMDDAGQKEPWNRNEGRAKGREGPASKKGLDPDTAKFYMSFGI